MVLKYIFYILFYKVQVRVQDLIHKAKPIDFTGFP